jgi:hypothetical protein
MLPAPEVNIVPTPFFGRLCTWKRTEFDVETANPRRRARPIDREPAPRKTSAHGSAEKVNDKDDRQNTPLRNDVSLRKL